MFAYILFFLAGLGFGYALTGPAAWIPLIFPTLLALGAAFRDGLSGDIIVKLVIALVVTGIGVVLGRLIAEREAREPAPG